MPPPVGLSLSDLCLVKLADAVVDKRVQYSRLAHLKAHNFTKLLEVLVSRNSVNDHVVKMALTEDRQQLLLEGATMLRRSVLNSIGYSCPNLMELDLSNCRQVTNSVVRLPLQKCRGLRVLRIDGCTRVSDAAFEPTPFAPPPCGLIGLRELSVSRCSQLTRQAVEQVIKAATNLIKCDVSCCRLAMTEDVVQQLVFLSSLTHLNMSFCPAVTDTALTPLAKDPRRSHLQSLAVQNCKISDIGMSAIATVCPSLKALNCSWCNISDESIAALAASCPKIEALRFCNTHITDEGMEKAWAAWAGIRVLDVSWCLRLTAASLERMPLEHPAMEHLNWSFCTPQVMQHECPSAGSPLSPWSPQRAPQHAHLDDGFFLPPAHPDFLDLGESATGEFEPLAPDPKESIRRSSTAMGAVVRSCAVSLTVLLLDGLPIVHKQTLEAVAECASLRELSIALGVCEDARAVPLSLQQVSPWESGLNVVSAACPLLTTLRIDASRCARHADIVSALAPPRFANLETMGLRACPAARGFTDGDISAVIRGRHPNPDEFNGHRCLRTLRTLDLNNCGSVSEALFKSLVVRAPARSDLDAVEEVRRLDEDLHAALGVPASHPPPPPPASTRRGRSAGIASSDHMQVAISSFATALRGLHNLTVTGCPSLTDECVVALATCCRQLQQLIIQDCSLVSEGVVDLVPPRCTGLRSLRVTSGDWAASYDLRSSRSLSRERRSSVTRRGGSGRGSRGRGSRTRMGTGSGNESN
mmetsp:Transcript_62058/g.142855  ORF Transcript_62058/g.142855 Transcript_62058/m.142855 type:complete len:755 (+) Transcript_62058:72-2336(+)